MLATVLLKYITQIIKMLRTQYCSTVLQNTHFMQPAAGALAYVIIAICRVTKDTQHDRIQQQPLKAQLPDNLSYYMHSLNELYILG